MTPLVESDHREHSVLINDLPFASDKVVEHVAVVDIATEHPVVTDPEGPVFVSHF